MYLTSYKSGVKTRIENLVSCVPVQPPLIYFFGNNLYIHPHRKERNKLENSVRPRVRLGFDAKVSFKSSKSGQISFLCSSLETSAKVDFPSRLWSHIPPTLYLYDNNLFTALYAINESTMLVAIFGIRIRVIQGVQG